MLVEPADGIFWEAVRREDPELYGSIKPWSKIFEPASLLALLLECGVSGPEAVAEPGWHRLVAAGGLVDNCPRHRLPIHSRRLISPES